MLTKLKSLLAKVTVGLTLLLNMVVPASVDAKDASTNEAVIEESAKQQTRSLSQPVVKKLAAHYTQPEKPKQKTNPKPSYASLFITNTPRNSRLDHQDQFYLEHVKAQNPERAAIHATTLNELKAQWAEGESLPQAKLNGKTQASLAYIDTLKRTEPTRAKLHSTLMYDIRTLKHQPYFLKARRLSNSLHNIKQKGERDPRLGSHYADTYDNVVAQIKAIKNQTLFKGHPWFTKSTPRFLADEVAQTISKPDPWGIRQARDQGQHAFANHMQRLKAEIETHPHTSPAKTLQPQITQEDSDNVYTQKWIDSELEKGNFGFAQYLITKREEFLAKQAQGSVNPQLT